jgi:hypothetical protein
MASVETVRGFLRLLRSSVTSLEMVLEKGHKRNREAQKAILSVAF